MYFIMLSLVMGRNWVRTAVMLFDNASHERVVDVQKTFEAAAKSFPQAC